ncbi:nucleotidyltransferase [Streptomyces phage Tomas]|uniref:Nucleotidyltransferase n=1 Tax=Streptomyces phage Tomas TaxID=2914443 RepID=A0AA49BT07_9CAUD|nr:nucleotidyltransferase [Streptomyces phage Tomas]UMO76295.1 nucleotidyltransferase [Streptomyces phage Tomas]
MTVLLRTIHGSHLYGLAHAGSDRDIYEVVATKRTRRKRNIKQTIVDGVDKTVVDMSTFMNMVDECVPQALEALWTPVAEIDKINEFRTQYRVNRAKMREVYIRTALNFAKNDDYKRRRHAVRLLLNLGTAMEFGKFNPELSGMDKLIINATMNPDANKYEDVFVELIDEVQKWT